MCSEMSIRDRISTITLNKIFRLAAKSKIILNSHRINNGEIFIKKDEIEDDVNEDFFYIKENNQDAILKEVM